MNEKIIYMNDLPFELNEEESDYLMEILPPEISSLGKRWGYNDTVFRDNLMEYIVGEKLKYNSIEEYYNSDVAKNYFNNKVTLSNEILFGKVEKFKIKFLVTFYDKDGGEIENSGSIGIIAKNSEKARKNAFFAVVTNMFRAGHVLKKLEIVNIK